MLETARSFETFLKLYQTKGANVRQQSLWPILSTIYQPSSVYRICFFTHFGQF